MHSRFAKRSNHFDAAVDAICLDRSSVTMEGGGGGLLLKKKALAYISPIPSLKYFQIILIMFSFTIEALTNFYTLFTKKCIMATSFLYICLYMYACLFAASRV